MSDRFHGSDIVNGFIILLCMLPLAIWKIIEIIVWIIKHVNIVIR